MQITIESLKKDVPSNVAALAKNISQLPLYDSLKPMESSAFEDEHCTPLSFQAAGQIATQVLLAVAEEKNQRSWQLLTIKACCNLQ